MRADSIQMVNVADGTSAGDMSGNLVFGTPVVAIGNNGQYGGLNLKNIFGYSIQANYSGSPAGTLKLQASNDGASWADIPNTSITLSGSGTYIWNVSNPNYLYVRVVWTATGGSSGSLSCPAYIRGF